jgi:hypothetical protein
MSDSANENGKSTSHSDQEPDAHGQAALMLAESILHALIDTSTLSLDGALAVVRVAQEAKTEVAIASHESCARMEQSLALLDQIAISLGTDSQ